MVRVSSGVRTTRRTRNDSSSQPALFYPAYAPNPSNWLISTRFSYAAAPSGAASRANFTYAKFSRFFFSLPSNNRTFDKVGSMGLKLSRNMGGKKCDQKKEDPISRIRYKNLPSACVKLPGRLVTLHAILYVSLHAGTTSRMLEATNEMKERRGTNSTPCARV